MAELQSKSNVNGRPGSEPSLSAIEAFVEQLAPATDTPPDRRRAHRYGAAFTAMAVMLDAKLEPDGAPFPVGVHNISARGVAMSHIRPVLSRHVGLELRRPDGRAVHVVVEVMRCQLMGLDYEIAGRFITSATG